MSQAPNKKSNAKAKQKKSEETIQYTYFLDIYLRLEKKLDCLKRQNLEMSTALKKLTNKTLQMHRNDLNQNQQEFFTEFRTKAQARNEQLELVRVAQVQRIEKLSKKNDDLQIQLGCLKYQLQRATQSLGQYKQTREKQFIQYEKQTAIQIANYQSIINNYQTTINQRIEFMNKSKELQIQLNNQKEERKRIIADKDRDLVLTVDHMKKDMMKKSAQLRENLLSMKWDQMTTNTRLTELQNQRLLEELDYQSRNTSRVLKKNEELEKKVKDMALEMQVQKEIENELASRATISKKILKTLNEKNNSMNQQIQQLNQQIQRLHNKDPTQTQKCADSPLSLPNFQKVNQLNSQLNQLKLVNEKLTQQKNHYKGLYEQVSPIVESFTKSQSDLRVLMIRFLKEGLHENVSLADKKNEQFNLNELKLKNIEEWSLKEIQQTVRILLTFIKPHFNTKSLKSFYLKHSSSEKQKSLKKEFDAELVKLGQQYQQQRDSLPHIYQSCNDTCKKDPLSIYKRTFKRSGKQNSSFYNNNQNKLKSRSLMSLKVRPAHQFSNNNNLKPLKKPQPTAAQSETVMFSSDNNNNKQPTTFQNCLPVTNQAGVVTKNKSKSNGSQRKHHKNKAEKAQSLHQSRVDADEQQQKKLQQMNQTTNLKDILRDSKNEQSITKMPYKSINQIEKQFKKQPKVLIRTTVRQWGKKVKMSKQILH